jgi:hypothetical protein
MTINETKQQIADNKLFGTVEQFKEWLEGRITMIRNDIAEYGETGEDMARLRLYQQALDAVK